MPTHDPIMFGGSSVGCTWLYMAVIRGGAFLCTLLVGDVQTEQVDFVSIIQDAVGEAQSGK